MMAMSIRWSAERAILWMELSEPTTPLKTLDSFSARKCPSSVSDDLVARARRVSGVAQ